ncbi:GrpB family protein [Sphingobacterium sp.]|uniref:GrpB family protein n=1 Tax=Sphingobacterium sp. TaxID=341027 RepID=UPI0031E3D019
MLLPFERYNPEWKKQFESIKLELQFLLNPLNPQIDHIGSTAVEGLAAKPIIDIQLGVESETDLERLPGLLKLPEIVYYEKYNQDWPERRFFILMKEPIHKIGVADVVKIDDDIPAILHDHGIRIAHLHAFVKGSSDWTRHLVLRDYLIAHPTIRESYQELKEKLTQLDWKDGNDYNRGKDKFLKTQEKIALAWYKRRKQ